MKLLSALMLTLSLTACSLAERGNDYEFGDITNGVLQGTSGILELQDKYCEESDSVAKSVLLKALQTVVPAYPEGGLCG